MAAVRSISVQKHDMFRRIEMESEEVNMEEMKISTDKSFFFPNLANSNNSTFSDNNLKIHNLDSLKEILPPNQNVYTACCVIFY